MDFLKLCNAASPLKKTINLGGYILSKSVWYELQQITKSGNSITDVFVFDTKEEAQAEMDFYKEFMPEYKYKIIKCSGNTL